jgi:hypothetical protein
MLFLWKISQEVNNEYDSFDSAIVVSSNPVAAKRIHPACDTQSGEAVFRYVEGEGWIWAHDGSFYGNSGWADLKDIKVQCVGEAASCFSEGAIVCSSFNAG